MDGNDYCPACYLLGTSPTLSTEPAKPAEPLYRIALSETDDGSMWTGTLANCTGRQLASVSAPDLEAVWAMLWAALPKLRRGR